MKIDKLNIELMIEHVANVLNFAQMPLFPFPCIGKPLKIHFLVSLQPYVIELLKFWLWVENESICVISEMSLKKECIP